jgi:hypothetical protein
MSSTGSNRGKAPAPVPPQTQSRQEEPDSDEERENEIRQLKQVIKNLQERFEKMGGSFTEHAKGTNDHIEQIMAQIGAIPPNNVITSTPKLPKAENFDGTRSKLRGFLTQMNMHLDVNKFKLTNDADKVIFVSTYLRGQAWDWLEPYVREYYEKDSSEWSNTAVNIFSSYDKFKEHLEKTFGDIDAKKTAERKLKRLRQTASASAYTAEFMQQAAILGWDDYALIPYYDEGLKSHIKDEIARVGDFDTMDKLIDFAVRIDNRFFDRQMQKKEVEGWRRGNGRPTHHRFQSQRQQQQRPNRNSDPYGPRPMELDAARLPDEEQKRRKDNRLCFNCGKPGHMSRDCRSKRDDKKPQQLRATQEKTQRLCATQEATTSVDSQLEEYDRQEQYPRIDLDTVESQGWTQYAWEPADSQEPTDEFPETPQESPRHNEFPETVEECLQLWTNLARGEIEEIPETPPEGYWMSYQEEQELRQVYETGGMAPGDPRRILFDESDDDEPYVSDTEGTCPCHKEDCACIGYARHPNHDLRATIGCYDYDCKVHMQGKLDHGGIEPKPSPRSRRPKWRQQLAATAWGKHMKAEALITFHGGNEISARVMIDSGAAGNFMDSDYASSGRVPTIRKRVATPLVGLNGEKLNEGITHHTEWINMVIGNHLEPICFDITGLGGYDVVLGIPWLRQHSPRIDWRRDEIHFDHCECTQTETRWTGREPQSIEGPSPGTAGTYCGPYEVDPKRSKQPRGRASGRIMDVSILATTEQSPDMSDDKLREYIMIHHKSRQALCATGEETQIPAEYQEYRDVFEAPADGVLPEHGPFDHEIRIKEGKEPTFRPIYQLSPLEMDTLKGYIEENLKKGYIQKSSSSAGYPIIFVPKKGGELRLCVDYRHLNEITIKDRHPLPLIQEMQDRIQGSVYFTKYDITNAYNRLRIKEGDEWKTAFRTKYGHFEYTVMPFGLTNAPAAFQRFIFSVLEEYLDIFVMAYLDDILVFSKNMEEHVQHNKKVLQKLREAKVTLKLKKCEFHVKETEFLGYVISENGFGMQEEKVRSILDWPTPRNVKEVQQFLGLCNYYRRSVDGFGKVAVNLNKLTKKDQKWVWDDQSEQAFKNLKNLFIERTILAPADPSKPYTVETDASDYALGARLTQPGSDGKPRPISFWSRKMIPAELNYDIHDKELLAIVSALKYWRAYLEGASHQVLVKSDHKNLTFFTSTKELTRRQARWAETLARYDYRIEHCPGTANSQADALSRRPDYAIGVKEAVPAILKTNEDGHLVYNHQILAATSEIRDDEWINRIKEGTMQDIIVQNIMTKDRATSKDELVYIHGLVYVPQRLQNEAIRRHHDDPAHGHMGVEKTVEHLSRNYYIPNMHKKVRRYIKQCDTCQRNKPSRHIPYGELQNSETPTRPWEWITIDFITKLPKSDGHDMIMVVVDRLTKYSYMIPTTETIDANTMAFLLFRYIFANHGTPQKMTSDRDKLFTSKMWQSFADLVGIEHRLSTAYHPRTNGQTERTNQTLEQYLRHYVNYQQDDWAKLLPMAQFAYNNAMHATTKETPFFANYGCNPSIIGETIGKQTEAEASRLLATELKQLHLQLARDIEFFNLRMKHYYDQGHQEGPDFKKGEKVYLLRRNIKTKRPSSKLDHLKLGPFEIEEKTGPVNYRLKLPDSMRRMHATFHISLLETAPENAELATNVEIEEETENEYEVENVLSMKRVSGKPHYLVKWKGYDTSENTWEPIENLTDCRQLVQQYHQQVKGTSQPRPTKKRPGRPRKETVRDLPTQLSASE